MKRRMGLPLMKLPPRPKCQLWPCRRPRLDGPELTLCRDHDEKARALLGRVRDFASALVARGSDPGSAAHLALVYSVPFLDNDLLRVHLFGKADATPDEFLERLAAAIGGN